MSVTSQDLEAVGRFAVEQLKSGGAESVEELLGKWRELQSLPWNERNGISIQQSEQHWFSVADTRIGR